MIVLGIESTAHTFGISLLEVKSKSKKILCNLREMYTTKSGGMIPAKLAEHHEEVCDQVLENAFIETGLSMKDVDLIAFSNAPGLGHALKIGSIFARTLATLHKKPLVGVNHCIAHLEVASLVTDASDPVLLYCSGANTQVIAYDGGKYRIFGETLDIGIGNFLDTFARKLGLGFPGGPKVEKLAAKSEKYVPLLYSVKGMDVAFSGLLTHLERKFISQLDLHRLDAAGAKLTRASRCKSQKSADTAALSPRMVSNSLETKERSDVPRQGGSTSDEEKVSKEDLCFSVQETVFAMMIEVAERALAHCDKKELVLGGGVACNKRLQEMARIMCKERGATCYIPENGLLVDNAAMIAWTGYLMHAKGGVVDDPATINIKPYERTDDVEVTWR